MRTSDIPGDTTAAFAARPTPLGRLVLAATADALVMCCYGAPGDVASRVTRAGLRAVEEEHADPAPRKVLEEAWTQLDAYLTGARRAFTVPVDLRLATPFSRRTVMALDAFVPYGRTATYAQLAEALERPRAARAVGTALGANPLCVVLPCHRIVGSGGSLNGYAGGLDAKRFLLGLEAESSPTGL
ncbi:methylated-DNA--[protein]-cysteine S-methyltransferase [Streptomyces sp. NPDC006967]|uniref:methylated-DNA--[protein]-cysteine S-methyltransferase n=1 Tax=unclassified Streptomyces TaxID=2593676 RepID=UPI0021566B43|nr:methylated-DNA--[protein]-cysteine S-methyltransferase [Streptomyces sp. SM1]